MADVDRMLDTLTARGLTVERLRVAHEVDDNNLWFLRRPGSGAEVQVECCPDGSPPFLIESDEARMEAPSVAEAIVAIERLLQRDL